MNLKEKLNKIKSGGTLDHAQSIKPVFNTGSAFKYKSKYSRVKSEDEFINQNDFSNVSF